MRPFPFEHQCCIKSRRCPAEVSRWDQKVTAEALSWRTWGRAAAALEAGEAGKEQGQQKVQKPDSNVA